MKTTWPPGGYPWRLRPQPPSPWRCRGAVFPGRVDSFAMLNVLVASAFAIAGILIVRTVLGRRVFHRKKKRHLAPPTRR